MATEEDSAIKSNANNYIYGNGNNGQTLQSKIMSRLCTCSGASKANCSKASNVTIHGDIVVPEVDKLN